ISEHAAPVSVARRRPTPARGSRAARTNRGSEIMAKGRADLQHENMERALNGATIGANWMAELAQQNVKQGMAAVEGMLTIFRNAADGFGHRASAVRQQSVALAEEAMGNAAEFGNRMVHLKDPLEWAEVQSEFLSKQAQTFAEGQRKLSQSLIQES